MCVVRLNSLTKHTVAKRILFTSLTIIQWLLISLAHSFARSHLSNCILKTIDGREKWHTSTRWDPLTLSYRMLYSFYQILELFCLLRACGWNMDVLYIFRVTFLFVLQQLFELWFCFFHFFSRLLLLQIAQIELATVFRNIWRLLNTKWLRGILISLLTL